MPRIRLKLPPTPEREVEVLFPEREIEVSRETIEVYRSKVPYAFAIDRQSEPKKAKQKDATGMRRRVETILAFGEDEGLYLPVPIAVKDRQEGELPYRFEEESANFWFVDGQVKRATGYAANQNARPQLWRAFLLAKSLARHGCAPSWFVVGEGTRLFRDPQWLSTFCRALWHHKIRIFAGGFGEVNKDNYSGFEAYITALSGWLAKVNEGARKIKRMEGVIPHSSKQAPFFLEFSEDRRHVYTRPEEWAIVSEMTHRIADGTLPNCFAVERWLKERGVVRSHAWVLQFLKRPYLDGWYECGTKEYVPRLLSQAGLFFDLDITSSFR
jgi:hypothetical protein